MKPETKTCQNCNKQFIIEPEDFDFYKKIDVLSPKKCPLCRAQQRLTFRNERVFYRRPCDRCKKEVVSMYSPNKPYTVWCHDCWFSDDWDPLDYGKEYDPHHPFFEQFNELWEKVPKVSLIYTKSINSEYTNISADSKNCYMIIESSNNENCIHCCWVQVCKDCIDVSFSHQTELSYESDDCYNSYKLFYSKGCHDSYESYFLLDCRGCSHCIGCVNLRNKQYYVFNKALSKKEYKKFIQSARLDTHSGIEKLRKQFSEFILKQPRKYAEIVNGIRSTGNYIKDAKNCRYCFHCYNAEDSKYGVHVWRNAKDCVDCDTTGRNAELMYNSMNAGIEASHYIGSALCWTCSFMDYSYYCFNSNHCFGCAGLRKKNYCILNKQYSKEDYKVLRGQIVEDMKERGEWGEFFPPFISTFGYNETAAQEQFPLSKEQARRQGFKWEDYPRGTFDKETVAWEDMPDSIHEAGNLDVTKEIFVCLECRKNYRIIPLEFKFYKHFEIPLPRLCPDCRHLRRFIARGPNRLWHRTCQCAGKESDKKIYQNTVEHLHKEKHCPNEFETTYAPERKEIVYCEACYQQEVV
ncbi:hypothetical protein MYX07_01540 [Patescibacteria group bacterium AH-259-L07]|nr:hypothetical protein [Patescibacteria group bacterium AH-259-L07]